MKEYKFFLIDIADYVATVTINNPKALNALSSPVINEMISVFEELAAMTEEVRCVILTGAGEKSFVAGADIKEMYAMDAEQGKAYGLLGSKAFQMIENLPQPVIAAVNGFALGGGCELAMACDIRIASDNARFAQPECGLGIIPGFAGTQRMPRLCGKGFAKMMIYSCKQIKAEEAKTFGLVQDVVPQAELLDTAKKMASKIAGNSPYAVMLAKEAINTGCELDFVSGNRLESNLFGLCFANQDQVDGMGAFVNKGKATFTGKALPKVQ